jgi:hypothetical protein
VKPPQANKDDSREDMWLCESVGCYAEVTQRVIVRIDPRTVTYAYVCDECSKQCAVSKELAEDTDFVFGHNAFVHEADISYFCLCACGHGKEYHRLKSCIGRDEDGNRCICRGFSP